MITSIHSKMARAALGWGIRDLAQVAKVGVATITRFENGQVAPNLATLAAIERALEDAGIEFGEDGSVRPPAAVTQFRTVQNGDGTYRAVTTLSDGDMVGMDGFESLADAKQWIAEVSAEWLANRSKSRR